MLSAFRFTLLDDFDRCKLQLQTSQIQHYECVSLLFFLTVLSNEHGSVCNFLPFSHSTQQADSEN